MKTDEPLLDPNIKIQYTIKRYHKRTRLIDVSVICRDALWSKEISKEKLDFTSKFWVFFIFSVKSRVAPSWQHVCCHFLCQLNLSESWFDRSGKRFQSPAGFCRRKTENMSVYTFCFLSKFCRSNSKLSHLDQESERLEINLSKKLI